MLGFFERFRELGEAVYDYLFWREDWTRTWSPVSFWLAVGCAGILFTVVAVYWNEAWAYLRRVSG